MAAATAEVESLSSIIKPRAETGGYFFEYIKLFKNTGGWGGWRGGGRRRVGAANDEGVSPRYQINECG